ncbi:MAG: hypothetical protein IKL20_05280 [Alistipes sp.]|nr:hypothetical protein [Alistipes sp.]
MQKFKTISIDEVNAIWQKGDYITKSDRLKLQSYTVTTLCEMCEGLTNEELAEVYFLESKNLWRVINIACCITGVYPEGLQMLKNTHIYYQLQNEAQELDGSDIFKKRVFIQVLFEQSLKEFKQNGNIEFQGRMPQKLFQFRQQTADNWFDSYSTTAAKLFAMIYAALGKDEAMAFIFGFTAYYLNKSQTFKYYAKSTDSNMNDTIFRILGEFTNVVGGDKSLIQNTGRVVLYKDL